jgi:CubicO group peptidase (beta-lactamase class C family)
MNRLPVLPRIAAAIAALACAAAASAADLSAPLAKALEGTQVPAIAALSMRGGKVVDQGVAGVRRNDQPGAATLADPWLIGSDAKPMTATLVARLVDRGLLSWTTPLAKMLPELAAGMRPEYRGVTLLQLMSHHAGLPHDTADIPFFNTFFADTRPLSAQRLAYLAKALAEAPVGPPGKQFEYSNTGFIVAAAVAERAAHASYEELMRKEVFEPLGMAHVQFGTTHEGQPLGHVKGAPAKEGDANPLMFAPAGNVSLPIGDWAAFCLDQMAGAHDHGKLLAPATYRRMQTAQPGGGSAGLGWGIQPSLAGHAGPVLMHAGSDGNWYAIVALFPATESGVLAVANAGEEMGGDKATRNAMMGLLP